MKTRKRIITVLFALTLFVTAGVGIVESNKNDVELNDLALANVEALAQGENTREDCEYSKYDECRELVIYPDRSDYDILPDYKKKPGWL